jgi:hypothetical protein
MLKTHAVFYLNNIDVCALCATVGRETTAIETYIVG